MKTSHWGKYRKLFASATALSFLLGTGLAYSAPFPSPAQTGTIASTEEPVEAHTSQSQSDSASEPDSQSEPESGLVLEGGTTTPGSQVTPFSENLTEIQPLDGQITPMVVGEFQVTYGGGCTEHTTDYGNDALTVRASGCTITTNGAPTTVDRLVIDTGSTPGTNVSVTLNDVNIDFTNAVDRAPIEITGNGTATLLLAGDNKAAAMQLGQWAGVEVGAAAALIIDSATESGSSTGTITATSTGGAGIGGNFFGSGSNITIAGGTVEATSTGGAGIGGGYGGSGSNITIAGGTITATSDIGAGIGGGYGWFGSNITITGGTVEATSDSGAGIGGGGGSGWDNSVSGSWGQPVNLTAKTTYGAQAVQGLTVETRHAYRTGNDTTWQTADASLLPDSQYLEVRAPAVQVSWDPGQGTWSENTPPPADCIPGGPEVQTPTAGQITAPNDKTFKGWQATIDNGTPIGNLIEVGDSNANVCAQLPDSLSGTEIVVAAVFEVTRQLDITGSPAFSYDQEGTWTLTPDGDASYEVSMKEGVSKTKTNRLVIDTGSTPETNVSVTLNDVNIDFTASAVNTAPIEITGSGTATLLLAGDNKAAAMQLGPWAGVEVGADATLIIDSATESGSSTGTITATSDIGAGIGGYGASGADITITGGTITATSDIGAGIGGGPGGPGSNITITGGTVEATSTWGAGIGGGYGGFGWDNSVSGSWGQPVNLTAKTEHGLQAVQGLTAETRHAYRTGNDTTWQTADASLLPNAQYLEVRAPAVQVSWDPGQGTWSENTPPPADCIPGGPEVQTPTAGQITAPNDKVVTGWRKIDINNQPYGPLLTGNNVCDLLAPEDSSEVKVAAAFEVTRQLDITGSPAFSYDQEGTWTLTPDGDASYEVSMKEGVSQTETNRLVIDTGSTPETNVSVTLNDVNIDFTASAVNTAPIEITGSGTATLLLAGDNKAAAMQLGPWAGVEVGADATLIIDSATETGSNTGTITATSDNGAGIGGGDGAFGTDITIAGGTVEAISTGGAGIGGGDGAFGTDITIAGGTVEAISTGGAGIGGGYGASGADITITGGTVEAISTGGAGIGGGYGSAGSIGNSILSSGNLEEPTRVTASSAGGAALEGFSPVTAEEGRLVQVWDSADSTLGTLHDPDSPDGAWSPTDTDGWVRVYTPVEAHSVTYDLAGGTWPESTPPGGLPEQLTMWDQVTIPDPTPPADHEFTRWERTETTPSAMSITGLFSYLTFNLAPSTATVLENVTSPVTLTAQYQRIRPTITTQSPLPDGTLGQAYTHTLQATGEGTITWALTQGDLPTGLELTETGLISGTPTTPGNSTFTVTATDTNGTSTTELAITIKPATPQPQPPTITTQSPLPDGTLGQAYTHTLQATGEGTITWALTQGDLPTGLELTETGLISGTPTTPGNSTFTVTATDTNGTSTTELTITIKPATPQPPAPPEKPEPAPKPDGGPGGKSTPGGTKPAKSETPELSTTGTTASIWATVALLAAAAGITLITTRRNKTS